MSIGVHVAVHSAHDDRDSLLKKTGEALYAAKRNGRNRVAVYCGAITAVNA